MSEVVDAIMKKCKFGKKVVLIRGTETYKCLLTDIMVTKDSRKFITEYRATCGISNDEAEELWYRIENRPLLKLRKDLLSWLGLGE